MFELILVTFLGLLFGSFIFFGLDDLFIDFYYLFVAKSKGKSRVSVKQLSVGRLQLIAVLIPAWHEASVIGKMLETSIDLIIYPRSKYHFFIGCYPNDEATTRAVQEASRKFPNIHPVMNQRAGPTNKADNLNSLYRGLVKYEAEVNTKFKIVVVQDAEDVIHPLSLRLFNYLIPLVDMLQIPVFPFEPPGTIKGFFAYLTQGTYADEFAENHLHAMIVREQLRTFVPSAGVGTAVRREVLDEMAKTGAPFDTKQLTEDYEFALRLKSLGYKTHFFFEGVERLLPDGKTVKERIAIREMFPNTFREAVRQKCRWIYGITFQAHDTRGPKVRNWKDAYVLYRDAKARWANLILGPAYIVLLCSFGLLLYSYLTGIPIWYYPMMDAWQVVFILSIITAVFALERQLVRGLAVADIYGAKQAVMAVLIPPLLPIRVIWGNLINFAATMRAWRIALFGTSAQRRRWAKTDHRVYASEIFLKAYKHKLGDLALQNKVINSKQLREILLKQRQTGKKLGKLLLDENLVDEVAYTRLLSQHFNLDYLNLTPASTDPSLAQLIPYNIAATFRLVPLAASRTTMVIATPEPLAYKVIDSLVLETKRRIIQVLSPSLAVDRALRVVYSAGSLTARTRLGRKLLQAGLIDEYQLIEALQIQEKTGRRLGDILVGLGYIESGSIERIMR